MYQMTVILTGIYILLCTNLLNDEPV